MLDAKNELGEFPSGRRWELRGIDWKRAGLPVAIVVLSVFFYLMNANYVTATNIANVSRQASVLAIATVGQNIIILSGGIDLSQGSVLGLISVVSATLVKLYGAVVGALMAMMVAMIIGIVQGLIVAIGKVQAFIVTMAGVSFLRGAAYIYTNGLPVTGLEGSFLTLGTGHALGVPIPAFVALVCFVLGELFLNRTKAGRYMYAIGGNEQAAVLSGINVKAHKVLAFAISGFMAGLASVVLTARIGSGQPTLGEGFQLESIAAAVIGGTSLRGGEGTMVGTFLGVVLISIISNGLNLMRVSSFIQLMITGGIIVLAAALDIWSKETGR